MGKKSKKRIEVFLNDQILIAYEDKKEIFKFDCVTWDKDHLTPIGSFLIYRKHEKYTSKKYKVRMDYAMFIYKGIAIHMAYMVAPMSYLKRFGIDCFGSHGCIRLSEDDAKSLFKWALMGTPVKVLK